MYLFFNKVVVVAADVHTQSKINKKEPPHHTKVAVEAVIKNLEKKKKKTQLLSLPGFPFTCTCFLPF